MVQSILDTDLYKLTMGQAVFQLFPDLKVKYKFMDRAQIDFPENFDNLLKKEIIKMGNLSLTKGEKNFLSNLDFLYPTYIDFLDGYKFNPNELDIKLINRKLHISIEGYWYRTILWEVPLMSIISELYFKITNQIIDLADTNLITHDINKVISLKEHNSYFADFGSRRRYSFENHDRIVSLFKKNGSYNFVGTSNVYLAYKHNIKAIGTHAHEWFMVHAALYGYKMANKMALDNWVNIYKGNLGIALTDTFTTDIFLKSFTKKYAKLYDGVRQDSGNPFEFTDKIVNHYKSLGIDPMSKVIVFSDGLNVRLANDIKEYCVGKIKSSFGIGTHFTNDLGVTPLRIVIKVSHVLVNGVWESAVKLSDNPTKNSGDIEEVELSKKILKL